MSLALPDVNVWLALASEEHSHWAAAMDWWEGQDESIVFCRFTQMDSCGCSQRRPRWMASR